MSKIYNHVLYHKSIGGKTVSFEEYKEELQEKLQNGFINQHKIWIYLPEDIELAKVSTQICNHFNLTKNYSVHLDFYVFTLLNVFKTNKQHFRKLQSIQFRKLRHSLFIL